MFIIFVANYCSLFMSPRPSRLRKISNPPIVSGFKPYGNKKGDENPITVFLQIEEYETLRLCDYKMLNHHQASVIMDVSRPTLTRIYAKARQKIAEALVLGKQIIIEGGKIYFDSDWFSCSSCGCYFNNPEKLDEIKECPLCKSTNFSKYNSIQDEPEESLILSSNICICPDCGFEQPLRSGYHCKEEICQKCRNKMVGKGSLNSKFF